MGKHKVKRIGKLNPNIIIDMDGAIKSYEEGYSVYELALKYKVNHGTMKLRLERYGIKIRNASEQKFITMNRPEVKVNISNGSKRSQSKRKETNLKKYGSEVAANTFKWKDDYEKENGVRHPNQREESRENMRGDNNPAKRTESKEKIKQKRWDEKTQEELDEIMSKTKQTWIDNTGFDNPMKVQENKEKAKQTNLERRGVEWVPQDPNVKEKIRETHASKMNITVLDRLNKLDLELVDDFTNVFSVVKVKCKKCGNIFETVLDYVFHDYGICRKCFPFSSSAAEREIREYIESILNDIEIIFNDRKILDGKEIDILIPSKNIGIEFDGVYSHSDKRGITENYHINKTNLANKKGYRLIHIFEDEWLYKKDIVKTRLKRILQVDNSIKIFARNCIIKEINSKMKNDFLINYHIQSWDVSSIKLGAFYNNELVSVMTFSKGNISKGSTATEGIWELNRFCSKPDYSIVGIGGKLLSYFKNNYKWVEIFSYCDRRWSDGNLYIKLGFELCKITKPNYWYIKGTKRIHRFNLRKRADEPKNISEWKLREAEGYYKIWDCGNFKFHVVNNIETN